MFPCGNSQLGDRAVLRRRQANIDRIDRVVPQDAVELAGPGRAQLIRERFRPLSLWAYIPAISTSGIFAIARPCVEPMNPAPRIATLMTISVIAGSGQQAAGSKYMVTLNQREVSIDFVSP